MKLGISSFTFSWAVGVDGHRPEKPLSLIDLIEIARGYGLTLVQIGDNLPLDLVEEGELHRAKALLDRYGMALEVGTRGLEDKRLEKYLDIAKYFGAKILRIVIDRNDYQPDEAQIVSILKRWAPRLEQAGVVLAIENHDRFKASTLDRIIRLTGSPNVGICLDTANSLGALEGIEEVTRMLARHTVNLHIKDVTVNRLPSQLGFEIKGAPACQGAIDVPRLIHKIKRNGKNANCILEQWTPFAQDLNHTIAQERRSADQSVAALREILAPGPAHQPVFGASAAYTLSKYGPQFGIEDILASMAQLAAAGFSSYQPELSFEWALDQWENGGVDRVNGCQASTGIVTRQLICHFALDYFETKELVLSDAGYAPMARFVALAKRLDNCRQVLLPIGPLPLPGPVNLDDMARIRDGYLNKLDDFARMIQRAGLAVSFELLPGNFIGPYAALFDAMESKGLAGFGVNFDTGHAIANGEDVVRLARDYGKHIMLTHLGDPAQPGGTKLAPGWGMVDWPRVVDALRASGYNMALDLEIMAAPQAVDRAYQAGKEYLTQVILAGRGQANAAKEEGV